MLRGRKDRKFFCPAAHFLSSRGNGAVTRSVGGLVLDEQAVRGEVSPRRRSAELLVARVARVATYALLI